MGRHQSAKAEPDGRTARGIQLGPVARRVASERPFIKGYYHPGEWRKRLDFGTGTFGDMGCHILDPVFGAIGVGNPSSIRSELPGPNDYNWSLDVQVKYIFPGTKFTTDTVALTWYNGNARPPKEVVEAHRRPPTRRGKAPF